MTLSELIAAFRLASDDKLAPYLWSDSEIAGYLADAESEACLRAKLLVDESTPTVSVIPIGTSPWVRLHSAIIEITRVRLESQSNSVLSRCPQDVLDQTEPGWEAQTGTPSRYFVDGYRLRLIPQPVLASDRLYLRVYRTPLVPLSADDLAGEPEIPEPHHARLLDWALYRAYSKRDEDSFDSTRSEYHRQLFVEDFGPRPSAHAVRQQAQKRRHAVYPIQF